ncbi:hypothetical protein K2X05_13800, partial [bacterium]|nr:hypothetical protein [bacterium]
LLVKDSTGLLGWTPRQNLLTPLHFSTKAQLVAQSPLYHSVNDSTPDPSLRLHKEQTVSVLDVQNTWARIAIGNLQVWTQSHFLYPIEKDPGYFFAKKDLSLRKLPQTKSFHLKRILAGSRLRPLEIRQPWAKVEFENQIGYIPISDVLTRIDIATRLKTEKGLVSASRKRMNEKIYAVYVNPLWLGTSTNRIPLFESPSASSPLIGQISPWKNLTQQDSIEQEWALSQLSDIGEVWWQIPQNSTIFRKLVRLPIHAIRDVKENPIFQHVKIATAGGLFRSTDGVLWTPLKGFEKTNPAFAFAQDGVLFVEDKISFDNGENFAPYVFWENLLKSLKQNNIGTKNQIKISSIETLNRNSQHIVLKLDLGGPQPVSMYTANRGRDWQYLRR